MQKNMMAGVLVSLLGFSSARTLLDTQVCGEILLNTDVNPLQGNLKPKVDTESLVKCKELCTTTPECNAAIFYKNNGSCYLKSVKATGFESKSRQDYDSFVFCATPAPTSAPPPTTTTEDCGDFREGFDVKGGNLESFKAGSTIDNQACLDLCTAKTGCNAAIRGTDGSCYLKTVEVASKPAFESGGFTSYLVCPATTAPAPTPSGSSTPAPGPVQTPSPVMAPAPTAVPPPPALDFCDKFLEDTDVIGDNLEVGGVRQTEIDSDAECVDLCTATPTCNAAISSGRHCYLKSVDVANKPITSFSGHKAYLVCPAVAPMTPVPAPEPTPVSVLAPEPVVAPEPTLAPEPTTEEVPAPAPTPEMMSAPEPSTEEVPAPAPTPVDMMSAPAPTPDDMMSAPAPTPVDMMSAPAPTPVDMMSAPAPTPEDMMSAPAPAPEEVPAPAPAPGLIVG